MPKNISEWNIVTQSGQQSIKWFPPTLNNKAILVVDFAIIYERSSQLLLLFLLAATLKHKTSEWHSLLFLFATFLFGLQVYGRDRRCSTHRQLFGNVVFATQTRITESQSNCSGTRGTRASKLTPVLADLTSEVQIDTINIESWWTEVIYVLLVPSDIDITSKSSSVLKQENIPL